MMLIAPKTALADEAEESERSEPREVEIELGNIEFTENLTMHELTSINPDMSLRPSTRPWTDKINDLWGVGLNGVNYEDAPYQNDTNYPYTLVGNGLASRIMVQFDNIIPRSVHPNDNLDDPATVRLRSVDVPGQYKLKDSNGNVYYTYCCDAATDANLKDTYNGKNLEEAKYYELDEAQHIRYICMNGYWGSAEGMGSLEAFRQLLVDNQILTAEEAALMSHGEALTATQAAIWKFGNSDKSTTDDQGNVINGFSVKEDVVVGAVLESYSFSSVNFDWVPEYITNTGNRVKKAYDFLVKGKIAPTANTTVINKSNSLIDIDIEVKERVSEGPAASDDIYLVDLTFEVGADIISSDDLQVTVSQNNATVKTVPLTAGVNEYKVEDLQLTENSQITLDLTGSRVLGNGVYIFEAKENAEAQTLVGLAVGTQYVGLSRDVLFSVSYEAECEISGEKQMKHGKLAEGQFSFQLIDPSGEVIDTVENDAEGKFTFKVQKYTVDDMKRADDDDCLTYTVKEVITDADGIIFDTSEKTVKVKLSFEGETFKAEVDDSSDEIVFVNDSEETVVEVYKVWKDENDQYKARPSSIIVHLLADGEETDLSLELNADNEWHGEFTGLPTYDGEREIEYTVEEENVTGYVCEVSKGSNAIFTITNTYNGDTPPTGDRDSMGHWLMVFSAAAMALDIIWMKQSRKEEE
nr:Cna B-type domain-containing protein [Erysipelotrichaceae bacterium]